MDTSNPISLLDAVTGERIMLQTTNAYEVELISADPYGIVVMEDDDPRSHFYPWHFVKRISWPVKKP